RCGEMAATIFSICGVGSAAGAGAGTNARTSDSFRAERSCGIGIRRGRWVTYNSPVRPDFPAMSRHTHAGHDHHHGHAHGHHHHDHGASTRVIAIALALTAVFALVEALGGMWAQSLALISDAGHMITDSVALALGLVAQVVSRRPPSQRN